MDKEKTSRTLSENFEGFSQILKEQKGEKGTVLGCVHKSNNNNLKIKTSDLKKNVHVGVVVN